MSQMPLSRRQFLATSGAALAALTVPRQLLGARSAADELQELRRGVGIFTGRGGTIGWLHNPGGALVVDSQFPDTASTFVTALRSRSATRLDALINTHHHADHTSGNEVFRGTTERIIAHANVPGLQRRVAEASAAAPAQTYADTTFENEWTHDVGDERVCARYYGPAHTGGDCTVLFEHAHVVHMGDLVFNRTYPFVDRSGGASVRGWLALLETVAAEHAADTLYIFGHAARGAPFTGGRKDVLIQRDLLSAVLEYATQAIAAGKSREEVVTIDRLPEFPDHTPLAQRLNAGAAVGAAFDELSEAQ
jgi:cyclase